jgi:hypothetical protein
MPNRRTKRSTGRKADGTIRKTRKADGEIRSTRQSSGHLAKEPPASKRGTSITDELAEQLADEAERGYDLDHAHRVGRKSLAGGAGHSPRVNFRMTTDLQARAEARAQREGKTISDIAREALERYV